VTHNAIVAAQNLSFISNIVIYYSQSDMQSSNMLIFAVFKNI